MGSSIHTYLVASDMHGVRTGGMLERTLKGLPSQYYHWKILIGKKIMNTATSLYQCLTNLSEADGDGLASSSCEGDNLRSLHVGPVSWLSSNRGLLAATGRADNWRKAAEIIDQTALQKWEVLRKENPNYILLLVCKNYLPHKTLIIVQCLTDSSRLISSAVARSCPKCT